eukprot:c10129_g2_i1.p1 GENE.c10129_g2_i1~~c10129_g2_i1.p1  ORF type:complete len:375 (+),score=118.25 c10129_g2_i1:3-1127(+)
MSATASPSKSASASLSATASVSATASRSATSSASSSSSVSASASPSSTPSVSATRSVSSTATRSATSSVSVTASSSSSVSPTSSMSAASSKSPTPSLSPTSSQSASSSLSATSSISSTATQSSTPSQSASVSTSSTASSSASSSRSASSSASSTQSASSTVSPSSTSSSSPSASPSPTGTPGYQLAIYTDDGACKTTGCVNVKADDPQTARVMIIVQRVVAAANEPNCNADGGSASGGYCVTNLNIRNVTDWSLTDINFYNFITNTVLVKWKTGYSPTITEPSVYPNTLLPVAAVGAVVNCSFTPYPTIYRVGWQYGATNNGPCYTDPVYPGLHCVSSGLNSSLNKYVDSNSNPMTTGTRYKDLVCPDQTGITT